MDLENARQAYDTQSAIALVRARFALPVGRGLDLFGKGSLFELLSTARLRTGEDTLAVLDATETARAVVAGLAALLVVLVVFPALHVIRPFDIVGMHQQRLRSRDGDQIMFH